MTEPQLPDTERVRQACIEADKRRGNNPAGESSVTGAFHRLTGPRQPTDHNVVACPLCNPDSKSLAAQPLSESQRVMQQHHDARRAADPAQPHALIERINAYLGNGGFFNPEMMDHGKVRDLLIDIRTTLTRTREGQVMKVFKRRVAACDVSGFLTAVMAAAYEDESGETQVLAVAPVNLRGITSTVERGDGAYITSEVLDYAIWYLAAVEIHLPLQQGQNKVKITR